MDAPNSRRATGPWCGGHWKRSGFLSRASCGAANAPGWWRSPPPQPPRNLCPTAHKGAPSNRGTTMLESPPRQRQRWGEATSIPNHPRLCENHKRSLIGGPRKNGGSRGWATLGQGRRSRFCPSAPTPGASLASFWASRKKLAAGAAKSPAPAPPGANPLGPGAVDSGRGVMLPSRASCGAANAPGWWRSPPAL